MRLRLQSGRLGDLVSGRSRAHILAAAQRLGVRKWTRRKLKPGWPPTEWVLVARMNTGRLVRGSQRREAGVKGQVPFLGTTTSFKTISPYISEHIMNAQSLSSESGRVFGYNQPTEEPREPKSPKFLAN